jgi:BirA family biotin operon repressor/biotin-[acetyl-CoA-carboxylase] ligase
MIQHYLKQIFPDKFFILDVLHSVDSTNRYLLEKDTDDLIPVGFQDASVRILKSDGYICLAEQQTAGRGRQGKSWVSPSGVNLYCSILWPFKQPIIKLMGLSLMVGTVIAQTLENYGVPDIGLKWPNDIYVQKNKKIAGILIETTNNHKGLNNIVIGIGLNVLLSKILNAADSMIDQPWTDVASHVAFSPDRTQLTLLLLKNLLTALPRFEENGFGAFQSLWLDKDIMLNQTITLQANGKRVEGIAKGVDKTGHLIVETIDGLHYFSSADIERKIT